MPTAPDAAEILPCPDAPFDPALTQRVVDELAGGALVAMPTETVYGLAARADSREAIQALERTKQRSAHQGLTWHAPGPEVLGRPLALLPLARRLAERYWPGPLTLVLSGVPDGLEAASIDGRVGIRVPAQRGTLDVLAACPFPVVMSSANLRGETPLLDAESVRDAFRGELALVLDGGPSRLAEASGVLLLEPGRIELLREGLLPIEDLRRTAGLSIAFVCTGNTCRSPMAETIARDELARRLGTDDLARFGFVVRSMGVMAAHGAPASGHAVAAMATRGLDLSKHASHPAIPEEVAAFDRVYCLTASHAQALVASLPPGRADAIQLLDPEGLDVPDPIGGTAEDYERCAAAISRAITARAEDWA